MFNVFVFNGLGFNYLSLFHYSWDLKPSMKNAETSPAIKQTGDTKPVMVDVRFL